MSLLQEMQLYFKGERNLGLFMLLMAFLMIIAVFYLWKVYKEPLGIGLMLPLTLLALAGLLAAPMLVKTSIKRSKRFTSMLEKDKAGFLKEEVPRMQKVNANWFRLKLTWLTLALVGLAVIFFVKNPFWLGIGVGLFFLASTFMTIDVFAEKRAQRYTHALQQKPSS